MPGESEFEHVNASGSDHDAEMKAADEPESVTKAGVYAERCSRLLDLKSIGKPPVFDGTERAFSEWRFKVENLLLMLGLDKTVKETENQIELTDEDLLPEAQREMSRFLYSFLVQIVSGKALAILRLCPQGRTSWMAKVDRVL